MKCFTTVHNHMLSTHTLHYNCPQSHVINTHVTLQLSTITCYQHNIKCITTVHNHMLSTHTYITTVHNHMLSTHVTLQLSTITCYQHNMKCFTTVHNHMLSTHTLHNEIVLYTGILSQNIDHVNQNNR